LGVNTLSIIQGYSDSYSKDYSFLGQPSLLAQAAGPMYDERLPGSGGGPNVHQRRAWLKRGWHIARTAHTRARHQNRHGTEVGYCAVAICRAIFLLFIPYWILSIPRSLVLPRSTIRLCVIVPVQARFCNLQFSPGNLGLGNFEGRRI